MRSVECVYALCFVVLCMRRALIIQYALISFTILHFVRTNSQTAAAAAQNQHHKTPLGT